MRFSNVPVAKKTIIIFGLIFFTFLTNQLIVFYIQKNAKNTSSNAINAAGRNRMLSQRISAASFQILSGNSEAVNVLKKSIFLHDSTINVLEFGGTVPGMADVKLDALEGDPKSELLKVKELWEPFKACAVWLSEDQHASEANAYIHEHSNSMLASDNKLVKAIVKDAELALENPDVISSVINVAGRNRMLSQKIGLLSMSILQGKREDLKALGECIALHDKTLDWIIKGGYNEELKINFSGLKGETLAQGRITNNKWIDYKKSADVILGAEEYLACLDKIVKGYTGLLVQNNNLVKAIVKYSNHKQANAEKLLNTVVILMVIVVILIIALGYFGILKFIVRPLTKISSQVKVLSTGEVPELKLVVQKDEIGELHDSVKQMVSNIESYSLFSKEIGQGKFETDFSVASEKDDLGLSLIEMRDQLKSVESEGEIRNWKTEGMAKFADLLRGTDTDLKAYSETLIINIVEYLNANQGAVYILNDENEENLLLDLKAAYAYDRSKFIEESIKPGEGLVGQAYVEGKYIYMTNVPDNFAKITSGLGEASPSCFIILPLAVNGEILGVLELASFTEFAPHQIEFLETLSESIASSLKSAKTNERTKVLLLNSREMQESLQSQEEELRQTMEEMQATQDTMQDREQDLIKQIEALKKNK